MPENKRLKLIAIFSAEKVSPSLISEVGAFLSVKWGGCNIVRGEGFWSKCGNKDLNEYPDDSIFQEQSIKIELTVHPHSEEKALDSINEIMQTIKDRNAMNLRFVHVEKTPCIVDHQDLRFCFWGGGKSKEANDTLIGP